MHGNKTKINQPINLKYINQFFLYYFDFLTFVGSSPDKSMSCFGLYFYKLH